MDSGCRNDAPERFCRPVTVFAFNALYRLSVTVAICARGNVKRFSSRKFTSATFGRRYVPIGSTFKVIVGMVLPPVKRTCRANASPLVWWYVADARISLGRMYVPAIFASQSHVSSDVLIRALGVKYPALSPAAENVGLDVPKPVPRASPAAPIGQSFFVAE